MREDIRLAILEFIAREYDWLTMDDQFNFDHGQMFPGLDIAYPSNARYAKRLREVELSLLDLNETSPACHDCFFFDRNRFGQTACIRDRYCVDQEEILTDDNIPF